MMIGVLKEIKRDENRVAITPAGAEVMRRHGHDRLLEKGAGVASGFGDGIVHYAVSNLPGALPRTSSAALTNAALPYALQIADKGWRRAMQENPEIKCGANVVKGHVTYRGVAEALDMDYSPVDALL